MPVGAGERLMIAGGCLVACLLLCSCATRYRPGKGHYGYSEARVGKDEYDVSFLGNKNTSYERAQDFALLRAAELALQQQAKSFHVVDVVNLSSARRYTTPSQYYQTASPFLSTGGRVPPFTPEFRSGLGESYIMEIPPQERIFYKPGVRLRVSFSDQPPKAGGYDPATLVDRLKKKYRLN